MAHVVLPNTIQSGTEMVAAEVQGNDEALRDEINGGLDDNNLSSAYQASTGLDKRWLMGIIASDGSVTAGAGFTASHPSSGSYTISITTAFASTPIVMVIPNTGSAVGARLVTVTTSSVDIQLFTTTSGAAVNVGFYFMMREA